MTSKCCSAACFDPVTSVLLCFSTGADRLSWWHSLQGLQHDCGIQNSCQQLVKDTQLCHKSRQKHIKTFNNAMLLQKLSVNGTILLKMVLPEIQHRYAQYRSDSFFLSFRKFYIGIGYLIVHAHVSLFLHYINH